MSTRTSKARARKTPVFIPVNHADVLIGIDPGTDTGIAIYDRKTRLFIRLSTVKIHNALFAVKEFVENNHDLKVVVFVENPKTYRRFGNVSPKVQLAKAGGGGSIKRDFVIWQDFLTSLKVEFYGISLLKSEGGCEKKMEEPLFKQITGYQKQTSEHARDAAMLVFGR
jgi:hypothetical protein